MAVRFDASADRLLRTASLPSYNSAYTVAFWLYISVDRNTWQDFFSINDGTTNNYDSIGTTNSGTILQLDCIVGGAGSFPTGSNLATGTWHHIALVRSSTTSLVGFLNGVSNLTATTNVSGRSASPTRMEFSGTASEGEWLSGRIAHVKIWTAALTAAELVAEMQTIAPVRTADLHLWSPTLPGTAERLRDYSGNAFDWTEGGTLTDEDGPPVLWFAPLSYLPLPAGAAPPPIDEGGAMTPLRGIWGP